MDASAAAPLLRLGRLVADPRRHNRLSLPRGVPSHDTFGRVFTRLDLSQVEEVLRQWINALGVASGGKLIVVDDGKGPRRSFGHAWGAATTMTHIVSAFASENRLVLARSRACRTRGMRSPPSPGCWP
jgi:hypothetical protein